MIKPEIFFQRPNHLLEIFFGDYQKNVPISHNFLYFRIVISNLHKETKKNFSDVITDLYKMTRYGRPTPMISEQHYKIIMENADRLNSAIVFNRDFNYQYFGFKTLERSYLLKIDGRVVERPQHMLMRVSVGKFWVFLRVYGELHVI